MPTASHAVSRNRVGIHSSVVTILRRRHSVLSNDPIPPTTIILCEYVSGKCPQLSSSPPVAGPGVYCGGNTKVLSADDFSYAGNLGKAGIHPRKGVESQKLLAVVSKEVEVCLVAIGSAMSKLVTVDYGHPLYRG
jgi:hypothetical protein